MACSICGKAGHNRRTCTAKSDSSHDSSESPIQSKNLVTGKSQIRTYSTTITGTSTEFVNAKDSVILIRKDFLSLQEFLKSRKTVNNEELRSRKPTYISNSNDQIRKKQDEDEKVPVKPVVHDSGIRKPKSKPLGKHWLNEDAKARLDAGPTKDDGSGHIYIYKMSSPRCEDDNNAYKIGMSKDLPDRRIYAQQRANGQKYVKVFSDETPFRYLAENVIHRQLKSQRTPKPSGDGRTEWFTGSREEFIDTIKKVNREVNVLYSN